MFESVTPHHLPLHRQRFQDVRRVPVDCCQERPFKAVGQAMGISDRMAKIYVARARLSIRDALAK